jgi:hypothetical protein
MCITTNAKDHYCGQYLKRDMTYYMRRHTVRFRKSIPQVHYWRGGITYIVPRRNTAWRCPSLSLVGNLIHHSSLKMINYLVEAFPEHLQGTNDRAPLFHYCCGIGKSDKWRWILDYVASKYPEVTHTPDFEGLYPIHHLARGKSVEVLNL